MTDFPLIIRPTFPPNSSLSYTLYAYKALSVKINWDPNKAAKNIARHRVTFDDAASVFSLPDYLRFTLYDLAHDSEEDRWITIGLVARGLLLVVYTTRGEHDDEYRIISARVADADERHTYAQHLAGDLP